MSTPSMPMPMICATASYLRSMAKSSRPVSARRDPERGWVLLVPPGAFRLRYCCSSASMVVGRPSMTMVPRCGRPSAPMGRLTRLLYLEPRFRSRVSLPIGADGQAHPTSEPGLQILLEKIRRFHDVHVAVDEPEPIFHHALLESQCAAAFTPMTAGCPMRRILLAAGMV